MILDQVMIGTVEAKWRVKYLGREIEDCVLLTDVWVFDEAAGGSSAGIRARFRHRIA